MFGRSLEVYSFPLALFETTHQLIRKPEKSVALFRTAVTMRPQYVMK
jgi:hypothetical protein